MLSRRHIRIKVLQALYELGKDGEIDTVVGIRKLERSIDRIFELFLYELKAISDVHQFAREQIELKRNRKLPSKEDLNPKLKFVENRFLVWLENNIQFKSGIEKFKINWGDEKEILIRVFKEFQESSEYQDYMSSDDNSLANDKKIVKVFYGKHLVYSEVFHQLYEEKELHWADDLDAAQMMVAKTLKSFDESSDDSTSLPNLLKDKSDLDFAKVLYRDCRKNDDKYAELIHAKTKNWEMDRIAQIDILLMKMALSELINFNQIPIKVSLNEYIEISKEYSTPKSGNFINGILDKLKIDLTENGEIKKIGRGLL
tara:strand:- start:420 stop:1361 length:942 start_codon:yes stop_codon:yes gene_type:complete